MTSEANVQEAPSQTTAPRADASRQPSHEGTRRADALRALAESTSIAEVMSRSIVCLDREARVEAVTQMFLDRGISNAPVVDADWQPLGMVTKTDLLRALCQFGGMSKTPESDEQSPVDGGTKVGDITMPYVLSLHEEAPVSVAAALMAYEGAHCLPIVSSTGEVVGVVSTLDIIKWVAKSTDLDVASQQ